MEVTVRESKLKNEEAGDNSNNDNKKNKNRIRKFEKKLEITKLKECREFVMDNDWKRMRNKKHKERRTEKRKRTGQSKEKEKRMLLNS